MPDCESDGTSGVLIFCEDELNFVMALVATWIAGAVAIPAAGGMTANLQRRNEHIIRRSQPDLILHDLPQQAAGALQEMIPTAKMVALMDIEHDGSALPDVPMPDAPMPVARLLQFTSGSTLDPKPVLLDSQTIAAGCTALQNAFGPCGLSADAIAPSYGMAEVTLLASSGQRKGGPEFDARHSTVPVANLGKIVPELALTLRDPGTHTPCRDGTVGEILFDGPGIGWVIARDEDWRIPRPKKPISTGDFGYVVEGQIHIIGRSSNKIILRGRNVYAEDVEALTRASQVAGVLKRPCRGWIA